MSRPMVVVEVAGRTRRRAALLGRAGLVGAAVLCAASLSGCSSAPSIEGVWTAADGGQDKVIDASGDCSGMYYNNGQVLDIGGPETCTLGSADDDGTYPLVVRQPPNQATYRVRFDGDVMTFTSGGRTITLTKQ